MKDVSIVIVGLFIGITHCIDDMQVKEQWLQLDAGKVEDKAPGAWCQKADWELEEKEMLKNITVELLSQNDVENAIEMIMKVYIEVENLDITLQEARTEWDNDNDLEDCEDINRSYFENGGIFLIARDGQKIIGSGSIKKIDNESCELKRMYLLKEYRAKKIGYAIVSQLLGFAQKSGYKEVYLSVWKKNTQQRAIAFYEKLGFQECLRYSNESAEIFMRKSF